MPRWLEYFGCGVAWFLFIHAVLFRVCDLEVDQWGTMHADRTRHGIFGSDRVVLVLDTTFLILNILILIEIMVNCHEYTIQAIQSFILFLNMIDIMMDLLIHYYIPKDTELLPLLSIHSIKH